MTLGFDAAMYSLRIRAQTLVTSLVGFMRGRVWLLSVSVKLRHLAAARTLCLVVSCSPSKTAWVMLGSCSIARRNKKYAESVFLGALGSLRLPFLDLPPSLGRSVEVLLSDVLGVTWTSSRPSPAPTAPASRLRRGTLASWTRAKLRSVDQHPWRRGQH